MPVVKRFNRCRIEMYFGDHAPPHFHVITRKEERVSVVIKTLQMLAGNADVRETREALEWARAHRAVLYARWKDYSETL
jgi:hypothetical protein